jgi:signal transduction histidine kinase
MTPPDDDAREGHLGLLDAELLAPALLHELRQPLMGADAAATLLERVAGAALTAREEWRLLRQQLGRLAEVMDGYNELFSAGDAAPEPFEVGRAIARAVDLLAHRVRPLAGRFALTGEEEPLRGFGAPSALVHAATNLLSNALDAVEMVDGGARVAVRVLPASAGVEVRISDEGVGIPEDVRARVFEPRFTTKPPGKGTGLGLHLSRRLMARFGGDVYLVEAGDPALLPWAVTEFCIALPAPPSGGGL